MNSRAFRFWLAVLFVFAGGMTLWYAARLFPQGASGKEETTDIVTGPLTEFSLTERSGDKFESSSLDGQVWVASFFFTSCPQNCLKQNMKISELVQKYGPQGVRFLSITCDPQRDTPHKLAEYADKLGADPEQWLFMTGKLDYIQQLGEDFFQVTVESATHSEHLITVDRLGMVRGYFHWADPEQMKKFDEHIDQLLAASPSAADEPAEVESESTVGG